MPLLLTPEVSGGCFKQPQSGSALAFKSIYQACAHVGMGAVTELRLRPSEGSRGFKSTLLQQPARCLRRSPEPPRNGILQSSEELLQQVFVKNKCQMRSCAYHSARSSTCRSVLKG